MSDAGRIKDAREALDAMDDLARMECGVDPIGPRGVLEKLIAEHEALLRRVADAEADAQRWRWYQNECSVCLDEMESDEREAYADHEIASGILAEVDT